MSYMERHQMAGLVDKDASTFPVTIIAVMMEAKNTYGDPSMVVFNPSRLNDIITQKGTVYTVATYELQDIRQYQLEVREIEETA